MNCPVCEVNLIMSERSGVEIDYCPKCRGVWLDRGELDKIIERSSIQNTQQEKPSNYFSNNNYNKKKKESWLGEIFDF